MGCPAGGRRGGGSAGRRKGSAGDLHAILPGSVPLYSCGSRRARGLMARSPAITGVAGRPELQLPLAIVPTTIEGGEHRAAPRATRVQLRDRAQQQETASAMQSAHRALRSQPCRHLRANELLGYPADARLLIINADDFGMSHAINAAILRTLTEGVARSTTLMAPCPWALHAMRLLRDHPDIAFGVHLTVVSEFADYRWGPLTPRDRVPSLLDETGSFYSNDRQAELLARARLDELEAEFRAQIETVLCRRPEADPPRLALPVRRRAARHLRPDARAGHASTAWRCASSTRPGANGCSGGACPPPTTGWWTARGWRRRARRPGLCGCCASCRPG